MLALLPDLIRANMSDGTEGLLASALAIKHGPEPPCYRERLELLQSDFYNRSSLVTEITTRHPIGRVDLPLKRQPRKFVLTVSEMHVLIFEGDILQVDNVVRCRLVALHPLVHHIDVWVLVQEDVRGFISWYSHLLHQG